jgi:hypothetical protein
MIVPNQTPEALKEEHEEVGTIIVLNRGKEVNNSHLISSSGTVNMPAVKQPFFPHTNGRFCL